MNRKNLYSGRDKELFEMSEQYEAAKAEGKSIYLDADDCADLADWYALRGNYQTAKEITEYGLNLHPDSTPLLVEQAYLFIDSRDREKAKQIAESIHDDYSPEVKILKANILLGEGRKDEAEKLLDTIKGKETLPDIVEIVYTFIDMACLEEARKWLERGKQYADDEAYIAVTADLLYAERKDEEAIKYYNQLIDKNPYSAPYWYGLARCYLDTRQYDKAIEACDYAIVSDEDYAEAYLTRGHAYFHLGNEEEAIKNYLTAEKYKIVAPDFINSFIAMNKLSHGEWEEGYTYLELAIHASEPDSESLPLFYANAALCLHKMGKKRKAHQYCKKAYEINPKDIDAHMIEGRIYLEEGDREKAAQRWSMALLYSPYADTWYDIGENCLEAGDLEFAQMAFEHVKEMEPDFEGVNERLAAVYLMMMDMKNFQKYNRLCANPINAKDAENIRRLLTENNMEELGKIFKRLMGS